MLRRCVRYLFPLAAALVICSSATGAANGQWLTGDFHTHTFLTDGSHTEADVVGHAFDTFGLDWMANSEHGGAFNRDPQGAFWENSLPVPFIASQPGKDKDGHSLMWRWQSLRDCSYPIIAALRSRYPGKTLFQSVEWNVPGHEHASVGIITDEMTSVSDFEYQFDASDNDTSRASQGLKKLNGSHTDAVIAAMYLSKNYPQSSYILLNHPSRRQKYTIADIRDLNNAAPSVCIGFEGFPGHQKESFRGGYDSDLGEKTYRARTYGGADYMVAKVGGLWDSLLAEKRHFWMFVNSDFHSSAADADFYPGEYAKTYVYSRERSEQGVLDAMRSGNVFAVQGDLINALDFSAASGTNRATMGQDLAAPKGGPVTVTIRFKSPDQNNNGDKPSVDHVDLIVGEVTGQVKPGDPLYGKEDNSNAKVVARFTNKDWTVDKDGYCTIVYHVSNVQNAIYLRLRGANLGLGVENETDMDGNPLNDDLAKNRGLENAGEAYADLWFYSNPIFVNVGK